MIIVNCTNRKLEACLKEYRQKADRIGQLDELRSRKNHEKHSSKRRKEKQLAKYKSKKNGNFEL